MSNAPRKSGPGAGKRMATTAPTKSKTATKSNAPQSSYSKNRKYARPAAPRYSVQNEPTADRYREIQQALKAKGYLQADPTGKWDNSSTDALRRFQQDQNLDASGKLDSLSLIALGLGPKRTANAQARP
ncbi:MAG: peptidoglycan-binding protein [Acidobacteria bacterium]|nr:peptidoglycan-binding protein [Acidobacteriota bacterium]